MEPPKKLFAQLTEDKIGKLLVEKDSINTQNDTRTVVRLYLNSHSCNYFVINNCGLIYSLWYLTKHLMTAPSGNICFVHLKSQCFKSQHQDSWET